MLEAILDPVRRIAFREQYYGKQPLLIRGCPDKFAGLFTWEDLSRLLNSLSWPHHYVHSLIPDRDESVTADELLARCRAGDSMVFALLDRFHPKVGELARALEAETGEPAFVTLFLSQPSQAAFLRHYDQQDVFVLQVDGYKAWSVYGQTVEKPVEFLFEDPGEPPNDAVIECELAPGDVLYIPRGHWHQALAQREMSLHLTLGVRARTGIDFLTWLADELRRDVRFRHELPLSFAQEPAEVREGRLREHIDNLAEVLCSRLADPETLQSFIEWCVAADRDVRRFKFPVQLFASPSTQLSVRHFSRPDRQRFVLKDGPAAELITFRVWGHIFRFPKNARALLEFIVSRTAFAYDDALAHAGELTEQGVREVLDPLLREGILDAAHEA